ncbi:hypothetical protein B0A52_04769 [Exophiala mesophila]|uniref:Transmembrane protein n=1 Tax=Exophiala mesophila TaxID=212818 RepID=A0A438N6C1_EXOME|nr:hypothetical protein B0A52_04769 [Exophiala mesophila]
MTDTSRTHQIDLVYPQIVLALSYDSILARSNDLDQTVTPLERAQPSIMQATSLSDSWTSLPDADSSFEDDVDSEHTDLGSLLDVRSADDVQSVTGTDIQDDGSEADSLEDEDRPQEQESSILDFPNLPASPIFASRSVRFSPMSPYHPESHMDADLSLDLSRPHTTREGQNARDLTHTEQSAVRTQHQLDEKTQIESAIRLSLSSHGLDLASYDCFKVILLGKNVHEFRPEIQAKLGDALVSSASSSVCSSASASATRFHLVPNTFGPGSEPDFADLVAIDKQIEFEYYDQAMEAVDTCNSPKGELHLQNSETNTRISSRWNGQDFTISRQRWTPPDLAILCLELDVMGQLDTPSKHFVEFIRRHNLPCIAIRLNQNLAGSCQEYLQDGVLREDIEVTEPTSPDSRVIASVPVDISTFLSLDSADLNKHITWALNTPRPPPEKPVAFTPKLGRSTMVDLWRNMAFPSPLHLLVGVISFGVILNLVAGIFLRPAWPASVQSTTNMPIVAVRTGVASTALVPSKSAQVVSMESPSVLSTIATATTTTSMSVSTALPSPQAPTVVDDVHQEPYMSKVQGNVVMIRAQLQRHLVPASIQLRNVLGTARETMESLIALELDKAAKEHLAIAQNRAQHVVGMVRFRVKSLWE